MTARRSSSLLWMNLAFATSVFTPSFTTCWERCESKMERPSTIGQRSTSFMTTCWPAHPAVCRARFHAEGACHVREQHLLLERQHIAPETGWLARPCRCVYPAHRAALRKETKCAHGFRSVERAQPLRLLGRRRSESILRALRSDCEDHQVHRSLRCGSEDRAPLERHGFPSFSRM
jgi:hypothetical protein